MTAKTDVKAICHEFGGLHPDPTVDDATWCAWLDAFNSTPKARVVRCADCGGLMVERRGKYGTFLGCENYPTCTVTARAA